MAVPPAASNVNGPRRRWRAHPVRWSLLAAVVALLVVLLACELAGWRFLRGPIERQLGPRLERELSVGEGFRLHLLGPVRLSTDRLHVGGPSWAPADRRAFFDAEGLKVKVYWSELLRFAFGDRERPIDIELLEVDRFAASLWRQSDRRANWQIGPPKPEDEQKASVGLPGFGRLVVRNGRLDLDDRPMDLALKAEATTDEGEGGEGRLAIKGEGRWQESRFTLGLQSKGVLPLISREPGVTVPLQLQAQAPGTRFTFDGQARDVMSFQAMDGQVTLAGTSLARLGDALSITLPTTAAFSLQGRVVKDGGRWQAKVPGLAVGSSRLAGDFTLDQTGAKPVLTGLLSGRNLDLLDLGPAFGTRTPDGAPVRRSGDRVLPQREFNIPALSRMNADVRVRLDRADLHTPLLEALTPLQARITLQDGVLAIDELLARTAGGSLQGRLGLDGRDEKRPQWTVDLRASDVDLDRWLKARNARAGGEDAPAPGYVSGRLQLKTTLAGQGRSIATLAESLDGDLSAWIRNGRISHLVVEALGLDVAQGLGLLLSKDKSLPLTCAVMQFGVRDGRMTTEVGLFDTPDSTVLLTGTIGLADERLALTAQARPKDFSPLTLRSPLHVEGSFGDPKVRLDARTLGLKGAAAVALAFVNPLAALIPLIDPGDRDNAGGCGQAVAALRAGERAAPAAKGSAGNGRSR
ncbi:AsmA family protein [Aquabacterium sp. J223]|uniref:AsmA family protein n=1 Tax=Aquabacterium sp. J223 TaxID=2898431 RepID=UPI0021ADA567|nr:AsmA family protein [Aquabacterium sp. J223]UUX94261.1 AsmA family protein [Aquabacterium sp. J223]